MDGVGEGIIGGNDLQPLRFKEDHPDSACQRKQIDGDDRRAEDDGLLPLKKSPDRDSQPAAEQRAKRDDEERAQPVEAFWSRPAQGGSSHQHNHPENGCRDKTGQRLPNNDGPVTDGGEQEFLYGALLPLQGRGKPAGNHAARGDQQQDRRQHRILEQRDVLWTQRLLRNADADGTGLSLRLIVSDDGVRDGSPDIVGEIEIEVVDLYQERCSLMCLHAPGEIRRDGDNGSHVELPVEGLCLLGARDADAKHIRLDDGLNDLCADGAAVEIDDGDGIATNRCCSQVLHQQIGERDKQGRDDQDPHAEPDAQILFANLPYSVHESSHVSLSSLRDPAEAHGQRCAEYKAERKATQDQAIGEQTQRIGGEPLKGKLLEHDGIVHWKQARDLLHSYRGLSVPLFFLSGPKTPLRKKSGTDRPRVSVVRMMRCFKAMPSMTPAATNTSSVSSETPRTIRKWVGQSPTTKIRTASTTATGTSPTTSAPSIFPTRTAHKLAGARSSSLMVACSHSRAAPMPACKRPATMRLITRIEIDRNGM